MRGTSFGLCRADEGNTAGPGLIKLSLESWKLPFVMRLAPMLAPLLIVVALALVTASAEAQEQALHQIPDSYLRFAGEAVTIDSGQASDTFIAGLGWLSGSSAPPPIRVGDQLFLGPTNIERLGLEAAAMPAGPPAQEVATWAAPLTANVRFGGTSEIRVVVDLPELSSAEALSSLERQGTLTEGAALSLELPRLALPPEQPDPYHGIDVTLLETATGTRIELRGPELSYRTFMLEDPTRLVIDVVPIRKKRIEARSETLLEGVVYRSFGAATPSGESLVHLLEIAPQAGEFRVVGTTEVARTLSELADGAFAAINAGYFDTRTFQAIGLLRVDYGLQSLPSRNRASIGFGYHGPVMTRVSARVDVRVAGTLYRREAPNGKDGVQVYSTPGAIVGTVRQGSLIAQNGLITGNRVGPVVVPVGGFVVVYPPEDRELALIDPGAPVSIDVDFDPDAFQTIRYAVEAGPLLIQDGRGAFEPDREEFSRGQRILDAYTQQSAIGIREDGTVLFLVADDMRAEDLVPLFLSLGAQHAMRLDSGSSATLMAGGKILNRIGERRIVTAIVFLPEGS